VQNVELKARIRDLPTARRIAERLATDYLGWQHQIDTYFRCPRGRLKLREIEGQQAQLVGYQRPDETGPKLSDYRLTTVTESESLKETLAAALDVLVVVDKRREIFLYQNVRIHLDEVIDLGRFLEFEAVLSDQVDQAQGEAQLAFLRAEFAIDPDDLLAVSYADLLLREVGTRTVGGS
jgi:predicted adenylyl cyclase CyaB